MPINTNSATVCSKCKYTCELPSQLKKHFKNNSHCKMTNEDINEYFINIYKHKYKIEDNIIACSHCCKVFTRKDALVRHNKISKCGKANATTIKEDTFPETMPTVYKNYVQNDDIANINDFE